MHSVKSGSVLWLSCHVFFSCESGEPWGSSLSAGAGSSEASERALHTGDEREPQSGDIRQGEAAQGLGVEMQTLQTHAHWIWARTWELYTHSPLQVITNLKEVNLFPNRISHSFTIQTWCVFKITLTRIVTHTYGHSLLCGLWLALMISTVEYHWPRILSTHVIVISFVCLGSVWFVVITVLEQCIDNIFSGYSGTI